MNEAIPLPSRAALLLLALPFALASCTRPAAPPEALPLRVEAGEVFVQVHPAEGFLFIKEYYLSTLETEPRKIEAQAAEIRRLVETKGYCQRRYGFTVFTAMEEELFQDRGFVTVECRLLSRERDAKVLLQDAFGRVLDRPVQVGVEPDKVGIFFEGADISRRGTNGEGFAKGKERALYWDRKLRAFEVVFGPEGRPESSFRSLAPSFPEKVSSPEMSKAEIEAWKRQR